MEAGTVLRSRYRLDELLGRGGAGEVFRAFDTRTGEHVAIKLLRPVSLAPEPEEIARFQREGEALSALNHPNIVRVYDRFDESGRSFIVMELVEGGSLGDLLTASAPLPIPRVLGIALDLADALTRVHHLGIVHRDIKPANVLLAADGTPRLSDFGVALFTRKGRLSGSSTLIGTLEYLSPEVVLGEEADARSDLWGLGVSLFELITGRRPFGAEHGGAGGVLHAIVSSAPPDIEALRPDCPTELVDLVRRLLVRDRTARIPTARHVGAELERVIARTLAPHTGRPLVAPTNAFARTSTASAPGAARTELPVPATPFIGRETELGELARLLNDPSVRLVTVLAPGGMGKSRLVLEAARQLVEAEDAFAATRPGRGAWSPRVSFIELAHVTSAELVLPALVEATDLKLHPGSDAKAQLVAHLRGVARLLVLDNFEHVIEAAELVGELLLGAPGLKVLATSRQRLGLSSEHLLHLEGLGSEGDELGIDPFEDSGVRLFIASARRAQPKLEATEALALDALRICRLVHGLPLGIVLAAAWVNVLSPSEIADEIAGTFEFLRADFRDLPPRHRSLRAVFDLSYERRSEAERDVAARLSIFRGGFTREAAQRIAGATLATLTTLVENSLIVREPDTGRYSVHELLRQYGALRLEGVPGEPARTARQHASYYASFFGERSARLKTPDSSGAVAELEVELPNLHAAWTPLIESRDAGAVAIALEALGLLRELRGSFLESEGLVKAAVASASVLEPARGSAEGLALGRALELAARASIDGWHNQDGVELATRALDLLDEASHPLDAAHALMIRAVGLFWLGEVEAATIARERALSLCAGAGDDWETARALRLLAQCPTWFDPVRSEAYLRWSVDLDRSLGLAEAVTAQTLSVLGSVVAERGEYVEGSALMRRGLDALAAAGNTNGRILCLHALASAERMQGNYDAAEACVRTSLVLARGSFPSAEAWGHLLLGNILKERDLLDEAAFHFQAARADPDTLHAANATMDLGDIAMLRGDLEEAGALLKNALSRFERLQTSWGVALSLDYLGHLALLERRSGDARELFDRALRASRAARSPPLELNIVASVAHGDAARGALGRAVEILTFVAEHPRAERQTLARRVMPLLRDLARALEPSAFAESEARGRSLKLDHLVEEIVTDPTRATPIEREAR